MVRRASRALTRLALVAGGLLVVELGLHAYNAWRGEPPATEIADLLHRVEGWQVPVDEPSSRSTEVVWPEVPDPYLGFTTDLLSRRLATQAETFTDDNYEVMVMGGSVAVGQATMGAEDLELTIAADPRLGGRTVRVINLARGAYKQPQQLHLLALTLTHGWRPDAVINLDGFNEVAISLQNALDHGIHPSRPAYFIWGPLVRAFSTGPELRAKALDVERERQRARTLAGPQPLGLQHSALVSTFNVLRLRETVRRFEHARDAYLEELQSGVLDGSLSGPPIEPGFEAALDHAVRSWAENSRSMHALCAARSIAYLHVLQPTLHDQGSKPLTPEELAAGELGPAIWARAAREGYPRLRTEGARLAALGVPFHDASQLFASDERTLYYDACHFDVPGQILLSLEMGQAFLKHLP